MFNLLKTKLAVGTAVAAAVLSTASSAHAVTFDFVAYALNNEHAAPLAGETLTNSGISVTTTARNLANTVGYLAYFDDLSGGEPGGLGVCKGIGGGGECDPSEDDNIGKNEVIELLFNTAVVINFIELSNGTHIDLYNGNFGVAIGGTPTSTGDFTQYLAQAVVNGIAGVGTKFSFISNSSFSGQESNENLLYISKIDVSRDVPEPATMTLFGLAAAGLAARRRKLV